MELNQYEIVLVNLDPTIGSEVKKTRPCLILSPDEMNRHIQTIVIAPITSSSKNYPTRIELQGKTTKGWVMIDQMRTIDKRRILKVFHKISVEEIKNVKTVIRETFVD
ncbi:MAG: type II toxin-antitoxin system PemK/MazF family toxin [Chitinophagales bacterium]|jgi:mRNA interferase MazF|nr:type II toxin-antitoxin system PemK/MazF family toxin [Sphingobacteriales bacterium]